MRRTEGGRRAASELSLSLVLAVAALLTLMLLIPPTPPASPFAAAPSPPAAGGPVYGPDVVSTATVPSLTPAYTAISIVNVTQLPGAASIGGVTNHLFVNYTGGSGTITFTWSHLPTGCSSVSASEIACLPTAGGGTVYDAKVVVSDGTTSASGWGSFYVASAASNSGTLTASAARAGYIGPDFWGTNYNYAVGSFANHTVASWLNGSPIRNLRMPLSNTVYAPTGVNWAQLMQFCTWIHCSSEFTIGGPDTTTLAQFNSAESNLSGFTSAYHVTPTLLVYGNEPNLWNVGAYAGLTNAKAAVVYAAAVQNMTSARNTYFSGVKQSGVDMTCYWSDMQPFFQDVLSKDGGSLAWMNNQCYTGQGVNQSLDPVNMFYGLENGKNSILETMPNELATLPTYCKAAGCGNLRIEQGEGGVGTSTTWTSLKTGYWDIPTETYEAISAMQYNFTTFRTWDLISGIGYHAYCDVGLLHFAGSCTGSANGWAWNGTTVRPSWFDYLDLYSHLGMGYTYDVSYSADPQVIGQLVLNSTAHTARLLLVNSNTSQSMGFSLGSGFPASSGAAQSRSLTQAGGSTPVIANDASLPSSFTLPAGGVMLLAYNTSTPGSAPPAPTGLGFTSITTTGATASWTQATGGGVLNDTLYLYFGSSCGTFLSAYSTGGAKTTYALTGLAAGTVYSGEVTAWNATGQSPASTCVSFTTTSDPGIPPAPAGLAVTNILQTSADLSWTQSAGGGIVNDTVYLYAAVSNCTGSPTKYSTGGAAVSEAFTGLTVGGQYSVTVTGWNATGQSPASACLEFQTIQFIPPASPYDVSVYEITWAEATVGWAQAPGGGVVNDTVFLYGGEGCNETLGGYSTGGPLTYLGLGGLNAANIYSVEVTAWNATGESIASPCVSFIMDPGPPGPGGNGTTGSNNSTANGTGTGGGSGGFHWPTFHGLEAPPPIELVVAGAAVMVLGVVALGTVPNRWRFSGLAFIAIGAAVAIAAGG